MRVSVLSSVLLLALLWTFCRTRDEFEVWRVEKVLGEHADRIHSVDASPDGRWVVTSSVQEVCLWSTVDGGKLRLPSNQRPLAFSADSSKLLVTVQENGAAVWDLQTSSSGKPLQGHSRAVLCGAFSPDGKLLATAAADFKIHVWETASGNLVASLQGFPSRIQFSADGKLLLGLSRDENEAWDTKTWRSLGRLQPEDKFVFAVSPSGRECVHLHGSNSACIAEVVSGRVLHELDGFPGLPTCSAFSADGKRLVAGFKDGFIRIWNAETGRLEAASRTGPNWILTCSVSPDGRRALARADDVDIWRASAGQPKGSPSWLALAVTAPTASIWETSTGQSVGRLCANVGQACFCGNGATIVTAGPGKTCTVWSQRRSASVWGLLTVPAAWLLLLIAAGLVWSLVRDWRARSEAFGTYAPVGQALLIAVWAGLLAILVMPELVAPFVKENVDQLVHSLQIGFVLAMAIAAAASLRGPWLRTAAFFAPLTLGCLALLLVYKLVSDTPDLSARIAMFLAPALAVGTVAGLAKKTGKGIVSGIVGGVLGAAAAFFMVLIVDKSTNVMSIKLLLYLPLAVAACQLPIAFAMKLVPDPDEV